MSATYELKETPESCSECEIKVLCEYRIKAKLYYIGTRHPDCPIKITEDNLRWILIRDFGDGLQFLACVKCNKEIMFDSHEVPKNFCPSCGIKLLPPLDK